MTARATRGWQIAIDMPYQITNIWNATIVSHDANGYVIGGAAWNGQIAHDGETDFGFTASGSSTPRPSTSMPPARPRLTSFPMRRPAWRRRPRPAARPC